MALIDTPFKLTLEEMLASAAVTLCLDRLEKAGISQKSLSEVCDTPQYGYTASASAEEVGPRFLRITDIKAGVVDWPNVPFCECANPAPYELKSGDLLIARSGSVGKSFIVTDLPETAVFASYMIRLRVDSGATPDYLYWCLQSQQFWQQIMGARRGSAMTNINGKMLALLRFPFPNAEMQDAIIAFQATLRERLRGAETSLPKLPAPLSDIPSIVARIEALAAKIEEARGLRRLVELDIRRLLLSAYNIITEHVEHLPMGHVAPLVRRPVEISASGSYPELGIRSFGRGTFHKPALDGVEVGSKRLFSIEPDDLVFSNVFAWEGAVAVVRPQDRGRYGSHRFITCVPKPELATPEFLCFHFLTRQGLEVLGDASPGGAGRNRTLGLDALARIEVPIPPLEKQRWFTGLLGKVDALKHLQAQTQAELDALLPSVLDRAFKGEL